MCLNEPGEGGLWVPFWKALSCSYAHNGVEVTFPDSESTLLTFLRLKGREPDNEVGEEETVLPLEIRLGHFAAEDC